MSVLWGVGGRDPEAHFQGLKQVMPQQAMSIEPLLGVHVILCI